jgi:hypothetical protein
LLTFFGNGMFAAPARGIKFIFGIESGVVENYFGYSGTLIRFNSDASTVQAVFTSAPLNGR